MNNSIKIQIPKKKEHLNIIRLAASGIASNLNFPLDEIEDIKSAITEICCASINRKQTPEEELTLIFNITKKSITVTIKDGAEKTDSASFTNKNSMPISFVKSLMDELECICSYETGTTVKITKYKEETPFLL